MPTTESLRDTLNYFKQQREKKLQEARAFDLTIQQLERELGENIDGGEVSINVGDSLPPMVDRVEVSTNGRKPDIRPDEFFAMTQAEAARKYLKRVGHAVSFDELVSALQAGGCKVGGDNPKKVLYISLIRNTRDFVPPQQGYIGLREFYPGVARLGKEKVEKSSKRKSGKSKSRSSKKTTKKGTMKAKPAVKPAAALSGNPSELSAAVRSAMSDKQLHSADEIVSAASSVLGRPVPKIGVFGVLKKRDTFDKVDGKYKLK
jgi:hypothetical protein